MTSTTKFGAALAAMTLLVGLGATALLLAGAPALAAEAAAPGAGPGSEVWTVTCPPGINPCPAVGGLSPADDFKPMPTIGPGVEEIRVRDVTGAYRVIYTARLADAVYVLHVFQKKTSGTPRADIELAARRFRMLVRGRG